MNLTAQACIGLAAFPLIAWILGGRGRLGPVPAFRIAGAGLALQILIALLFLKVELVRDGVLLLNAGVDALMAGTRAGTSLVFGYLGGGALPFEETSPGGSFILAFQALPLVLVISALSALLFHWGVMQRIVLAFAWVLRRTMRVGGAAGVSSAANIFVGMVEAPLLVRPYLARLSRGELFMVMTVGMATVAGTVLVLYAQFAGGRVPLALGHIITASIISVPAAVMTARLMIPDEGADAAAEAEIEAPASVSSIDAITRGAADGVKLLISIIAMLVVFIALISLINAVLGVLPDVFGAPLTLERALGWAFAPVAWAMGVPWSESVTAGGLLGLKTAINEFVAYISLSATPVEQLSERSAVIMTYALCGFANPGSLGIMIGGLTAMCPERRAEIVKLAPLSLVSGTLATCLTGAVVGLVG
ncbi:MAG: NupC/NupG family nucleoside CNT transporter [Rhodospirillales bacterium]